MSHTFLGHVAAHGEPGGAVGVSALHDAVAPGDGHVVYDPLVHVVLMDAVIQKLHLLHLTLLLRVVRMFAQHLTGGVLAKIKL